MAGTGSGIHMGTAFMHLFFVVCFVFFFFLPFQGSRSSLDTASCRSVDSARPVGQVDRHIQLMVHGVAPAGKHYKTRQQINCTAAKQRNEASVVDLFA